MQHVQDNSRLCKRSLRMVRTLCSPSSCCVQFPMLCVGERRRDVSISVAWVQVRTSIGRPQPAGQQPCTALPTSATLASSDCCAPIAFAYAVMGCLFYVLCGALQDHADDR